jgi:peptide/nickel transport system ATP-binding protein
MSSVPLLSVRDLRVGFATEAGLLQAVDGISFDLRPGEVLSIVGESGSGKSVTAQTIMGLTRSKNSRIEGSVLLEGHELTTAGDAEMRGLRGDRIAMIFQDPMTSFNPVYRIGKQIAEAIRTHKGDVSKEEARARAVELFEAVGIPRAAQRVDDYPHEFSGGMRQRAMIAMALSLEPDVLIADEPTTALDVTIQAQILELLNELKAKLGMAILLITHDMGVIAETAQRVIVMYGAQVVEEAPVGELFKEPLHPYTQGLLRSIPRIDLAATQKQKLEAIPGTVPTLRGDIKPGCRFAPRCALAKPMHFENTPPLKEVRPGHKVACFLY